MPPVRAAPPPLRYLPGASDPDIVRAMGLYLNQLLLDERLTRRRRLTLS